METPNQESPQDNRDLNRDNYSISLSDAMAGVFTEPSETFSEVKSSARKNYWLIPLLILLLVSVISTVLVLKDQELSSEISEKQRAKMKEQFDNLVKEGKMTREEADEQYEKNEKFFGGMIFMIFGLTGTLFSVLIFFFGKSLIYWIINKILKGNANFIDVLNLAGLAGLISCVQIVINTSLAILTGKLLMNIGPVMFISRDSVSEPVYKLLASVDLINFWYLVVLSIGFSKFSGINQTNSYIIIFLLWLVWLMMVVFGPFGMFAGG